MHPTTKHIVVIGGGITGLTAAYELLKRCSVTGRKVEVTLIEKQPTLGGSIQTVRRDGFIREKGPDAFLSRKPGAVRLSRELGLEHEWVGVNPAAAKSFIYMGSRLHPLPEGLAMGIPTRVRPFISTPLLSPLAKARAAFDFLLPRRREAAGDESLGALISRRLGSEVADRLVGPILAGIYAGDLHQLSTAATFPQLQQMEARHRSIILGMLASRKQPKPQASASSPLPQALRGSMFLSFRTGLATLVERLADTLVQQGAVLATGRSISTVTRLEQHERRYELRLTDGSRLYADGVLMAAPAEQALLLLQGSSERLNDRLAQIPSVSVANVVLAFDGQPFAKPLQGSGFVVPRGAGQHITACTWSSEKWKHTAPAGKTLLRAYLGHAADQSHVQRSDQELVSQVMTDLQRLMGPTVTEPLFAEVSRHKAAMSQYLPGHLERLRELEAELAEAWPGLFVTGRSYRGVGIPDCIAQGEEAAQRLFEWMT
jgi:protoporphyrinogen/coproporphyrinogen III oxidase